jgi:hypothetical protein
MLRNAAALSVALALIGCSNPIGRLDALNGCYEGEGSPDFMRPPVHWAFRIADGVIADRAGKTLSRVTLARTMASMTAVTFSPGIRITVDEHKGSTVVAGDTVSGAAYLLRGRPIIRLRDDWGHVMKRTSCGPKV